MKTLINFSDNQSLSLISKVYIYSLIFECLLFFEIGNQDQIGFSFSISRVLQIFTLISMLVNFKYYYNNLKFDYKNLKFFIIYLIITISTTIIGIFLGFYKIKYDYSNIDEASGFAFILRSSNFRSFVEIFIFIYNVFYFIILNKIILTKNIHYLYFLKYFVLLLNINLFIGYFDLFFQLFGFELLPRHMNDLVFVGFRFHALAGEPRDCFVYLLFCISIIKLYSVVYNFNFLRKKTFVLIIFAALLTQSASGIIGLFISLFLFFIYNISRLSRRGIYLTFTFFIIISFIIYFSFTLSDRLALYLTDLDSIFSGIKDGLPPPPIYGGQMQNIYPIWDMLNNLSNFRLYPILFGKGYGSSAIINSNFGNYDSLTNPHSQFIRLIFESGILGTIIYCLSFLKPTINLSIKNYSKHKDIFILLIIFIIGICLGQRSNALFIYTGLFVNLLSKTNLTNEFKS